MLRFLLDLWHYRIIQGKGYQMILATHTEYDQLDKPAITDLGDGDWVMYQPVQPYQDAHGTVVAQMIFYNKADNLLDTSIYYSRAWCYWNYIDHTLEADFEYANWFMAYEEKYIHEEGIDHFIQLHQEVMESIDANVIPHDNPAWQQTVVALAYNAITNTKTFEYLIANSDVTAEQVQRMLDLAVGAVLQNPNFRLTGFRELNPK